MNDLTLYLKIIILLSVSLSLTNCKEKTKNRPVGVEFQTETIRRVGLSGDNFCLTWSTDGNQITSMDDGNWLRDTTHYHNRLYRLSGTPGHFTIKDIEGYPDFFHHTNSSWFGYGIISVEGIIYSAISKTPIDWWSGPFLGVKLLKSYDNGVSWYRVNHKGDERLLSHRDGLKNDLSDEEMFFIPEAGLTRQTQKAYPFSYFDFVQQGQDNRSTKDEYLYIYSPEGAYSNQLLLARVRSGKLEYKEEWEYFVRFRNGTPVWSKNIQERGIVHEFPEKNEAGEYFGWYSWLPSVVWNEGLGLYIMVNGGTYGGHGLTSDEKDYFDSWMHTKTGSLGFWYSENPYGPWTNFHYTDYWFGDNKNNRTYQPKLSPKWISEDGKEMVLIWSDAMSNEQGQTHTTNYKWNQMKINILIE